MDGTNLLLQLSDLQGVSDLTSLQPGNASVHANSSTQSSQPPARNLSQVQNATIVQLPDDSRSAVYTEPLGQNASMHMQDIHDIESDDDEAPKPKYGKKTRGRVKVKMQFITNKLRRYTTFSKRKTGIMKKAYELSTLTGTQVMLLVASETGHVYTFATKKLQPMITSESGKALIQTCLNSPENGVITQHDLDNDRRMNPHGFEETELCYAVGEDDEDGETAEREAGEVLLSGELSDGAQSDPLASPYQTQNSVPHTSSGGTGVNMGGNTFNINTIIPPSSNGDGTMSKLTNLSMQVPQSVNLQQLQSQGNMSQHQAQVPHPSLPQHIRGYNNNESNNQSHSLQQPSGSYNTKSFNTNNLTPTDQQLQRQKDEQQQEINRLQSQLNHEQEQALQNQLQIQQLQMQQQQHSQLMHQQPVSQSNAAVSTSTTSLLEESINTQQQLVLPKSSLLQVPNSSAGGGRVMQYQAAPHNQTLVYTAPAPSMATVPEGLALINLVPSVSQHGNTGYTAHFTSALSTQPSNNPQPQFITIPISQLTASGQMFQLGGSQQDGEKKT